MGRTEGRMRLKSKLEPDCKGQGFGSEGIRESLKIMTDIVHSNWVVLQRRESHAISGEKCITFRYYK